MTFSPGLEDLLDLARRFNEAATAKALNDPGLSVQMRQALKDRQFEYKTLTETVWIGIYNIDSLCATEDEAEPRLVNEVDPHILALQNLIAEAFESVAGLEAETEVPPEARTPEVSAAFAERDCHALARLFAPR